MADKKIDPKVVGNDTHVPIGAQVYPRDGGPFEGEKTQRQMIEWGASKVFAPDAGKFEPLAYVVAEDDVAEVQIARLVRAGPEEFAKYMRSNCKVRKAVACLYMFMVDLEGPALAVVACIVGKPMDGCLIVGRDKKDKSKLVTVDLKDVEGLDLPDVLACAKCGGKKVYRSSMMDARGKPMMVDCDECVIH